MLTATLRGHMDKPLTVACFAFNALGNDSLVLLQGGEGAFKAAGFFFSPHEQKTTALPLVYGLWCMRQGAGTSVQHACSLQTQFKGLSWRMNRVPLERSLSWFMSAASSFWILHCFIRVQHAVTDLSEDITSCICDNMSERSETIIHIVLLIMAWRNCYLSFSFYIIFLIHCCSFCPFAVTAHLWWLLLPAVAICLLIFLLSVIFYCCRKRAGEYVRQSNPVDVHMHLCQMFAVRIHAQLLFRSSQKYPE